MHTSSRLKSAVIVVAGLTVGTYVVLQPQAALAARKAITAAEADGTFTSNDAKRVQKIKVLSVGRGGLDRPGYNLQVEMTSSLRPTSANPEPFVEILEGYASIVGDQATFTPDEFSPNDCTVTLTFVRKGLVTASQRGSCGFINNANNLKGSFVKTSRKPPVFSSASQSPAAPSTPATAEGKLAVTITAKFPGGTGSTAFRESLTGPDIADYKVSIKAGQVLTLETSPINTVQMTLLDPDGDIVPDTGGMSGMGGQIDATGVHTIKVYLTEAQAKKNTKIEYTLKISVQNKR